MADEIELINAIELVDWDSEDTQFLVCEACGYVHCKRGDWVSIRRTDSLVLILPATDYIWTEDEQDKLEYRPPFYIKQRGIAYLDRSTYESLKSMHASFPAIDQIHPLSLKEATLLFHWDAPHRFLGDPPELRIRREIIVGTSEGNYIEHLQQMENLIRTQYEDDALAELRPLESHEHVISFYLDSSTFIDWKALVFNGSEYRLLVDSRYVIAAT